MTETFDATSTSGAKVAQSSFSWSHANAGDALVVMVAVVDVDVTGSTVSGVAFNGDALSPNVAEISGTCLVHIWYILAPDAGTHNIVVTLDGTYDLAWGHAVSYTGINQTSIISSASSNVGVGTDDATMALNTTVNKSTAVFIMATEDPSPSPGGAGDTVRQSDNQASGSSALSTWGPITPAATKSPVWTSIAAGKNWVVAGLSMKPDSVDDGDYFGDLYFSTAYFGARYFGGTKHSLTPGVVDGDYFGDRYFSTAYFGPRYWGGTKHALTTPGVSAARHLLLLGVGT